MHMSWIVHMYVQESICLNWVGRQRAAERTGIPKRLREMDSESRSLMRHDWRIEHSNIGITRLSYYSFRSCGVVQK